MDKDIIYFAEEVCGFKLPKWQKNLLLQIHEVYKKGGSCVIKVYKNQGKQALQNILISYELWSKNKRIKELQTQLALIEEALELACEKLPMEYEYCSSHPERYNLQDEYGCDEPYWVEEGGCEFDDPAKCLECVVNYFKAKAKEMMKSE